MTHKKTIVWLLTGLFLAGALLVGYVSRTDTVALPFDLRVASGGSVEQIRPWQDAGGSYTFFLPGYADLSQTEVGGEWSGRLTMNGTPLEAGMTMDAFPLDAQLEVLWETGGSSHLFTVTVLRSGKMPALYLDVKSGTMDYIHQEKNNKESGTLRLYGADGTLAQALDMEHLETRGNSTTGRQKKPYNLQLTQDADLLGMGAAKRWVLLANSFDDSHLRNKTVFDFAREIGLAWAPESRWVDLYLNGEYAGLYLLCERNEVHPQRLNLTGEGSFLVSKEWEWRMEEQGQHFVMTQDQTALRVHHSDLEDEALTAALQSSENAILAPDGMDPVTGKRREELIDLDSWVRKYLIEEVFANVDGGTLSQFFYRDGEGLLCAGPVWDYDLSMGNANAYPAHAPNMFFANREGTHGSAWYPALYRDPDFYDRMLKIYRQQFLPALDTLLTDTVPGYAASMEGAAKMDAVRWTTCWHTVDPAGETARILSYMESRLEFLNSIWLEGEAYHTVLVDIGDGIVMRYEVKPGETLPPLPEYADTPEIDYQGWYLAGTDIPFDPAQPIREDTRVYLKFGPVPAEEIQETLSPLRIAPAALFVLALAAVALWDHGTHKGRKHEREKHKVSP